MPDRLDIVCFANDWSADPTSKHQIMLRAAKSNRVLWVEASGMRRPNFLNLGDIRRIGQKLWKRGKTKTRATVPNLSVLPVLTVPLPGSRLAQRINRILYRRAVTRAMTRLGFGPAPVYWVFAPHVVPYLDRLPPGRIVYHCVDRWSEFSDYDSDLMTTWEAELCTRADLVFASARDLADHCSRYNDRVEYVPHGVDFRHFARALDGQAIPEDLRGIPEPRVGFFGLIHEWIDTDLLERLARRLPYSFVLIGDARTPVERLRSLPNVHLLGRKPYSELPDYCRGFHAALVPFRLNDLTRSVNPIKLREYAAAGLPIVSSALPEVVAMSEMAYVAETDDEWSTAIERAVARGLRPAERKQQSERARTYDWENIVRSLLDRIDGTVPAPTDR